MDAFNCFAPLQIGLERVRHLGISCPPPANSYEFMNVLSELRTCEHCRMPRDPSRYCGPEQDCSPIGRNFLPNAESPQFLLAQTDYVLPYIVLTHQDEVCPAVLQCSLYAGLPELSSKLFKTELS